MQNEKPLQAPTKETATSDEAIFTVRRDVIHTLFIATTFFVLGAIFGTLIYAQNNANTQELIQSVVEAMAFRQQQTLDELIESGVFGGSASPNAKQYVDDDPSIGILTVLFASVFTIPRYNRCWSNMKVKFGLYTVILQFWARLQ